MPRVIDFRVETPEQGHSMNDDKGEFLFGANSGLDLLHIDGEELLTVESDDVEVHLSDVELLAIRSAATLVEIIGGQPLDRIKVNMQMPKTERLPLRNLIGRGIGEFYSASTTSIIQRCLFYIPTLYLGYDLWDRHFKLEDSFQNGVLASCFASAIVTPGVSSFENLKTEQQLGRYKSQSMLQICRSLYATKGFTGVFPSLPSTFGREAVFACGICYVTPAMHELLKERGCDSVTIAGCVTGIMTQLMTHPLDTIKTWQENKKTGFIRSIRDIARQEGGRFFWNGAAPRCARGMWTFTCLYFCIDKFTSFYEKGKKNMWRS